MLTVRRLLNRLLEETSGQDLAEYALLMALLVLSAAAVLPDFAVALESAYNQMAQAFSPTKPTCCD